MLGKGHTLVLILVFIGIFYAFTSANIIGYTIYEPYYETNIIEEEIPFIVEHEYVEQETDYEEECDEEDIKFSVETWNGTYDCVKNENIKGEEVCIDKKAYCFLVIKNKGDISGEFIVGIFFAIGNERRYGDDIKQTIDSGEVKEFRWSSDIVAAYQDVYCDYIIKEVPKIEICNEKEINKSIIKTKNVTIMKNIEKEVIVNRNKTIHKNRYVNKVFGYEQKVYFGY